MLGTTMGSYRITRRLSAGAMGEVFVGEHTLLGRKAAIKLLLPHLSRRPTVIDRFFQEAKSTAAIGHPGIVEIFDFGYHEDGRAYLVMEFLDGEVLSSRIKRGGKMPLDRTIAILELVCSALSAAHQKGVIHRDLKPDNIFLLRDPGVPFGERPKILDFGIAKLSDGESTALKTGTGVIMGTPSYMSPEQCRGAGRVDHRADIYSLGCILFELVCGRRPFIGEGGGEVIGMQQFKDPPRPRDVAPNVHPAVESLILQLLAKDPEDRVQTAQALRERLADLEDLAERTEASVSLAAFATTGRTEQGPAMGPADIEHPGRHPRIGSSTGAASGVSSDMSSSAGYDDDADDTIPPGVEDGPAGRMDTNHPGSAPPVPNARTTTSHPHASTASAPRITQNSQMVPLFPSTGGHEPVSTTLNGAASERMGGTLPPGEKRSRRGLFAGLAAIAIAAGVAFVFLNGGLNLSPDSDSPDPTIATAKPDVAPAEPDVAPAEPDVAPAEPDVAPAEPDVAPAELVQLKIRSTPTGAYVRLRGTKDIIGTTPYTHEVERGGDPVNFDIAMRGYYKGRVSLSADKHASTTVKLKKRPKKTANDLLDIDH